MLGGFLKKKKIGKHNPKSVRNTQIIQGNDLRRKYASLCGTDCTSMTLSGEQKEDPDVAFLMFTAIGYPKSIFT